MSIIERVGMDDVRTVGQSRIDDTETCRRRGIVRAADAHNRIEGVFRGPETDAIVEAFVRGDIEATDLVSLLGRQPPPR